VATSAATPFASNGRALYHLQPYLGGVILFVPVPTNVGVHLTIAHGLRAIPRQLHKLYSTQFIDIKAWQPWDAVNIYIACSTTLTSADTLIIFVA
jgi:hypothetical protein